MADEVPNKTKIRREKRRSAVDSAQRMQGFDFATWRTGANDPVMRSTIIGLVQLSKAPDWQNLVERFDRASRLAPALRAKLIDAGGMTTPRMMVDPDFDLNFHIRRFRMPAGSTWDDVLDDARRQSMTDFDRDRPLWRVTVLEGLPGGKAAVIVKMHHAMVDGQGFVMLSASLFDFTPEEQDLGPMPDAPEGETLDRIGFAQAVVRDNFGWAAKTAQDLILGVGPATFAAMRSPGDTIARVAATAGSLARFTSVPMGPLSPIMRERSINYHFNTIEFPFAYMKEAAKKSSHTVNDVFLAAVSEGLGIYHQRLGVPVQTLRVNMPISTRKPGDSMENAVNVARFELPIETTDSVKLMDQISAIVKRIRAEPAIAYANQLGELSRLVPAGIVAAAAQASDVTASNVPGVPIPVWMSGAQVERMYPLVATVGAATNITMLTYNGTATIGMSSDDAAVPVPADLVDALRAGFSSVLGREIRDVQPFAEAPKKRATAKRAVRATKAVPGVKQATAAAKAVPGVKAGTAAAKKAPAVASQAASVVKKAPPVKRARTTAKKAPAVAKKAASAAKDAPAVANRAVSAAKQAPVVADGAVLAAKHAPTLVKAASTADKAASVAKASASAALKSAEVANAAVPAAKKVARKAKKAPARAAKKTVAAAQELVQEATPVSSVHAAGE